MREIMKNFIVIEGTDGSGTTTLTENLVKKIDEYDETIDRNILVTGYGRAEPTNGPIGKLIREILEKKNNVHRTPSIFARLFAADREDHILTMKKLQEPSNVNDYPNDYHIMVSDRYYYSSMVYQYDDLDMVMELNKDFPQPELRILLTIDPEVAVKRMNEREDVKNMFDNIESIRKHNDRYINVMTEVCHNEDPDNLLIIDTTNNTIEETLETAYEFVKHKILDKLEE